MTGKISRMEAMAEDGCGQVCRYRVSQLHGSIRHE